MEILKFLDVLTADPQWLVVILIVAMFLYYGEKRERRGEQRDAEMLNVIRENSRVIGEVKEVLKSWE